MRKLGRERAPPQRSRQRPRAATPTAAEGTRIAPPCRLQTRHTSHGARTSVAVSKPPTEAPHPESAHGRAAGERQEELMSNAKDPREHIVRCRMAVIAMVLGTTIAVSAGAQQTTADSAGRRTMP